MAADDAIHASASDIADRTPIVLVPGLGCSARLYQEQIPLLWRFGPVAVADTSRGETIEAMAQAILAASPPRFRLAGLSKGGYIALAIMRLAPERVVRLALLDTSAVPEKPQQSERRRAGIAIAERGDMDGLTELHWPAAVHESRVDDAAVKAIYHAMHEDVGFDVYMRQQRAIMGRADQRPHLAAIRCPTLVLVGDGDRLTPPAEAQEIAAGIPGAQLVVVAQCGHLSTLERPQAVSAALATWLS